MLLRPAAEHVAVTLVIVFALGMIALGLILFALFWFCVIATVTAMTRER
jgi:hypothetical protein